MSLVTTVALPNVRGPVPLVKSLGAIDRLSGGRLIVGVGPGSSDRDYAAVGIDFEERWARIDEAVETMRTLWRRDGSRFTGRFYSTDGVSLEPGPTSVDGPPVWIGSWGSLAGLRRVARLGDGWLASAYNTTPALFAAAWAALRDLLIQEGKDPWVFPNALATMWCYITEDAAEAARIIEERVAPAVPYSEIAWRSALPSGSQNSSTPSLRQASSESSSGRLLTRHASSNDLSPRFCQ